MALSQFTKNVIGATYIAAGGHDSNPGTKEEPKATIKALGNQVIGPGVYRGNTMAPNAQEVVIEADTPGTVKWITQQVNGQRDGTYRGIHFFGDPTFRFGNLEIKFVEDCIVENCTEIIGPGCDHRRCVIKNSNISTGKLYCQSSIVIDSDFTGRKIKDSYVSRFSKIIFEPAFISDLSHSNIEGVIIIDGFEYAIQDQFLGSPQENGYEVGVFWLNEANLTANGYTGVITGWDTQVATCMNRDPRFIDATRGVYKLQADSPMIGAAENGVDNIGGKPFGFFVTPDGANDETIFVIPSPNMDFTNPSQPFLPFSESIGTIRYVFKVSDVPINFDSPLDYEGLLAFDTSYAGGTPQNNTVPSLEPQDAVVELLTTATAPDNVTLKCTAHGLNVGEAVRYAGQPRLISSVPDANTIVVDAAFRAIVAQLQPFIGGSVRAITALNPNKLELQWRSTSSPTLPVNDAGWENDEPTRPQYAGQYFPIEFFRVPTKVISGNDVYGNADPLRPSGVGTIETFQLTWIDVVITFRNNHRA